MVSSKVTIKDAGGLHLRPAGRLCNEAIKYKSRIQIRAGDNYVNAKSVISVLSACVKCGHEIEFICEGEDEEEALKAMLDVVES